MAYSHVLISRPGPEAAKLAKLLAGLGLEPLSLPAFRFEPAYPGIDFSNAWLPGMRRLAIFSSTRAVEFGLRQLPAGFLERVEVAAIGPATAAALEDAGISVSILPEGGFNSEALLRHPSLTRKPGKALVFAAPGGRQALVQGLRELGWDAEFAHVYRAVAEEAGASEVDAIRNAHGILSVWTSANAMRHWAASMERSAWNRVCAGDFVVTSERLRGIASGHCRGGIHLTDGPGNKSIRDCILQLI